MGVLNVRIGARSSRLSKAQTSLVSELISSSFGDSLTLEFVPVKTLGDRLPPAAKRKLGKAGEKGAFTGDLEALLLDGKIDVAIHSMKDLPSEPTEGLEIGATPRRSDPRDALVSGRGGTMKTLSKSARVGTSSLRRKAQLMKMRPDLRVVELHGNVDTRLRKVAEGTGELDAIVLAVAGLERLGEKAKISQTFSVDEMVPALGQGTIAVQMRRGDRDVARVLAGIDDEATGLESACERAFALRLGADCNVPVGGCARVSGSEITMIGMVAKEDGTDYRRRSTSGPSSKAAPLGTRLAEALMEGARGGAAS